DARRDLGCQLGAEIELSEGRSYICQTRWQIDSARSLNRHFQVRCTPCDACSGRPLQIAELGSAVAVGLQPLEFVGQPGDDAPDVVSDLLPDKTRARLLSLLLQHFADAAGCLTTASFVRQELIEKLQGGRGLAHVFQASREAAEFRLDFL